MFDAAIIFSVSPAPIWPISLLVLPPWSCWLETAKGYPRVLLLDIEFYTTLVLWPFSAILQNIWKHMEKRNLLKIQIQKKIHLNVWSPAIQLLIYVSTQGVLCTARKVSFAYDWTFCGCLCGLMTVVRLEWCFKSQASAQEHCHEWSGTQDLLNICRYFPCVL